MALGALLFIRNPSVVLHPQFWHEDAIIFLAQQRSEGLGAIMHPYAGYGLLFPRIVAATAALLPLEFTPLLYLCGTYAGWLWVGAIILTSPLFASSRWAFFAVLAWVAVPHGGEVFLNLTNVQWALAAGLALLLAEGPVNRGLITRWIFVGLAALTGPFCLILTPLAIWRLWKAKRSLATVDSIALLSLIGSAFQLFIALSSSSRLQQTIATEPDRIALFLGIAVFPELFGTKAHFPTDLALRLTGTLAGLAGMAWATWGGIYGAAARRSLLSAAGLILISSLFAVKSGAPLAFGPGQRYLFIPFALYVWALIAAWSHCQKELRTWAFAFILLVAIGVHSSTNFISGGYPVPDWGEVCRLVRAGHAVEIQVAPLGARAIILPDHVPAAALK